MERYFPLPLAVWQWEGPLASLDVVYLLCKVGMLRLRSHDVHRLRDCTDCVHSGRLTASKEQSP